MKRMLVIRVCRYGKVVIHIARNRYENKVELMCGLSGLLVVYLIRSI